MSAFPCPRCEGHLQAGVLHEVDIHLCDGCESLFVPMRDNARLLRKIADELGDDLGNIGDESPDDHGQRACPKCSTTMSRFGFAGGNDFFVDRCSPCSSLFIDVEELTMLALFLSGTNKRINERREKAAADRREIEERLGDARTRLRRSLHRSFRGI